MGRQALLALLCISAALALVHAQLDAQEVQVARSHKHKEPKHNTEHWDEKIELDYQVRYWRDSSDEARIRLRLFCPNNANTASALPSDGATVAQGPFSAEPTGGSDSVGFPSIFGAPLEIAEVQALTHTELWLGGTQLLSTDCTEKGTILTQGFVDAGAAVDGGDYAITGGVGAYLGASGFVRISPIEGFDPRDRDDNGILGRGTYTIYLIHNKKHGHGKS